MEVQIIQNSETDLNIIKDKKIYLDKLFPKLNNANIQKLMIDHETVSYITTPFESKK